MKHLLLTLVSVAFAASVYAADSENTNSATVDHSKNPVTGTQKTTKKWKSKKKGADGTMNESETKEVTKEKTDGTVEKKTETESKSSAH